MNRKEFERFKEKLENMTQEEIIKELMWGDPYEFSYYCAFYLLEENQKLQEQIDIGKEQYNDLIDEKEKLEEINRILLIQSEGKCHNN